MASDAKSLRSERDRFVAFSFAAADLFLELDVDGIIQFVFGATRALTGFDPEDLIGAQLMDIVEPADQRVIKYILDGMKEGDRITPIALRMKEGSVSALLGACKLPSMNGHIHISLNTTGLPAAQSVNAHRDSETGVLDKNDFLKLAEDQLSLAAETGQNLELTLLKIDGLTEMRGRTDDAAMEEFLHKCGAIMRGNSLGGDSVGRLDDDKYGIMHSQAMDSEAIGEKVAELSREADPEGGVEISQNAVNMDPGTLSQNNATQALLFTINSFANSASEIFEIKSLTEGLSQKVDSTLQRITKLKRIFKNYDFDLAYQPIVDLKDKTPHHYEVLSRFSAGQSPYEIVTFSEQVGIIQDLDLAVSKKVKDQLLEWRPDGLFTPKLAINISGYSLESDQFVDSFLALFASNPELRGYVGIELTETSKIKDLQRAERIVQMFRKDGFDVYLDDLGTGSSSFEYIRALNVDYVKIDGAYVRDVLNNEKDRFILKAMSQLCRDLKIGTVAEMVETREQLIILQNLGVEYGQGWHFAKPMPAAEVPRTTGGISRNMLRKGNRQVWG